MAIYMHGALRLWQVIKVMGTGLMDMAIKLLLERFMSSHSILFIILLQWYVRYNDVQNKVHTFINIVLYRTVVLTHVQYVATCVHSGICMWICYNIINI